MSNQAMIAAKAIRAELQTRSASAIAQCSNLNELCNAQSVKIQQMQQAHELTERRFIEGSATLEQLQHSQDEVDAEQKKFLDLQRLFQSTKKLVTEIDSQIQQAERAIAAAQREFCAGQRSQAIAKIKTDKTLRQNLIAAMVANVGTGGSYTFSATVFVTQFVAQLLPEISEADVRAELDRFREFNKLN